MARVVLWLPARRSPIKRCQEYLRRKTLEVYQASKQLPLPEDQICHDGATEKVHLSCFMSKHGACPVNISNNVRTQMFLALSSIVVQCCLQANAFIKVLKIHFVIKKKLHFLLLSFLFLHLCFFLHSQLEAAGECRSTRE